MIDLFNTQCSRCDCRATFHVDEDGELRGCERCGCEQFASPPDLECNARRCHISLGQARQIALTAACEADARWQRAIDAEARLLDDVLE